MPDPPWEGELRRDFMRGLRVGKDRNMSDQVQEVKWEVLKKTTEKGNITRSVNNLL